MGELTDFAQKLRQTIPTARVLSQPEDVEIFAVDGVLPGLVTIPGNVEEAAQVVATAHEQQRTVLACGTGAQMNLGEIAERIDLVLQTTRLGRLLEHEGPDLTCHVEAGIKLAALQERLAAQGQWLALDPPGAQQVTIGGILATNASGPKRLRYGTARDQVIGLRVIQADGALARSGGRVVKNVAGYDLNKLYIGSLCTLGIIVEANFKLQPLPSAERTLLLSYIQVEDAMQTVQALLGSFLTPSALELLDARATQQLDETLTLSDEGYLLAVNFEGSERAIERQVAETRQLARTRHALLSNELPGPAQERFWEQVREHTQGTLICKAAVQVTQLAAYLRHLNTVCQRYNLEAATIAHAGNGVLYSELRPAEVTPQLVEAITTLRRYVAEYGGSLVLERCPVELKQLVSVWGEPREDFRLMQRLKQQFDPQGTFVRGRYLGGL